MASQKSRTKRQGKPAAWREVKRGLRRNAGLPKEQGEGEIH